jgi:hypothetical protein
MNDERENEKQYQIEKFNFVYHMPSLACAARFRVDYNGKARARVTLLDIYVRARHRTSTDSQRCKSRRQRWEPVRPAAHLQNHCLAQLAPLSSTHPALQPGIFRSIKWRIDRRHGTPQFRAVGASL